MSGSSGRGQSPQRQASGVQLDPNDPNDRKIIARQVNVARQAGRDGLDRAAVTRGRADLEAAYDEGAAEASVPVADGSGQGSPSPAPRGRRGRGGGTSTSGPRSAPSASRTRSATRSRGPSWGSLRPRSPARVPTRTADAGGFLTGLALYTVVIIYARYGAEGWKGWLSAKFLNKPLTTTTNPSTNKPTTKKGGTAAV